LDAPVEVSLLGLWLITMAQSLDAPVEGTIVAGMVFDIADDGAFEDPVER